MERIMECLATLTGPDWALAAYAQQKLDTNAFREPCFRWVREAGSELWLTSGRKVFSSDTFAGVVSFATKLGIDLGRAAREQPGSFANLYSCWARGDYDAVVLDPSAPSGVPSIAQLALWKMRAAPVESLAPAIDGDRLSFYTHHMASLGQSRYRHELVRFDVSLNDFSSTRNLVAELVDEG